MPVEIIIDSREKADNKEFFLTEIKKKYGQVKVEKLEYGDFELQQYPPDQGITLTIERKTKTDLAGSIHSHRLERQIANLIHNCKSGKKNPCLLVEMDPGEYTHMINNWQIEEALNTLNFMIPVIRVGSMKHTVKELVGLAKKIDKGMLRTLRVTPQIIRCESEWETLLCSFNGVSVEKAKTIAKTYPSLSQLKERIDSTHQYDKRLYDTKKAWNEVRWFNDIDGIGPGLGERVEKLFTEWRGVEDAS